MDSPRSPDSTGVATPSGLTAHLSSLTTGRVWLWLLTLTGLLLRLLALGEKSLLTDEGSSYYFSQLPLQQLIWKLCDPHPPAYYLLLRGLVALGETEGWLRLPSALAGALAVPLTWVLARELLASRPQIGRSRAERISLLAAALLAVAPLHVWYSQEARPYALVTLYALVMILAGLCWHRRPALGWAILFVLAGWLALFTEYGGLVAWGALNLFVLSGLAQARASVLKTVALAGLLTVPAAGGHRQRTAPPAWQWVALQIVLVAPFVAWWLVSPQRAVLSGPSYQATFLAVQAQRLGLELTPGSARRLLVIGLTSGAVLALIAALLARTSAAFRGLLRAPWVSAVAIALLVLLALLGVLPRLYTVKRHLVITMPYLAIAGALAVFRLQADKSSARRRWPWTGLALLMFLIPLSLVNILAIPKAPWREATASLAQVIQPGDSLWVDAWDAPVFDYYWRDRQSWQPLEAAELAALNKVPSEQRVWLAATVTIYRDLHRTLPPQFAGQRIVAEQQDWPGIAVVAYDSAPEAQPAPQPSQALLWGLELPSPLDTTCTSTQATP